jgi:hypothetical protein
LLSVQIAVQSLQATNFGKSGGADLIVGRDRLIKPEGAACIVEISQGKPLVASQPVNGI